MKLKLTLSDDYIYFKYLDLNFLTFLQTQFFKRWPMEMKQRIITVIKPINSELDDLWCSFFFLFWHFNFFRVERDSNQNKTNIMTNSSSQLEKSWDSMRHVRDRDETTRAQGETAECQCSIAAFQKALRKSCWHFNATFLNVSANVIDKVLHIIPILLLYIFLKASFFQSKPLSSHRLFPQEF